MNLREKLLPLVSWSLGNRKLCQIFGELWWLGAIQLKPLAGTSRTVKIEKLKDPQTDNWNVEKLVSLFRYTDSMAIVSNITPPSAKR